MPENLQVSLPGIVSYGQTFFLMIVSVALLCGDPGNPTTTSTAAAAAAAAAADASTTSSVSQQACQPEGCIFHSSSQLYLFIGWMEFKDIIVNGSMITMDTKEIESNYGGGRSVITATNYSMNFTHSYGDGAKFFNISMIFWMDMERHNWSLVMVAYRSSDDHSREEMEEDDYDDDDYDSDEDHNVGNNTMLVLTYPFWIGTAENTAYKCDDLAGISNNSGSELHIYDFMIQPFHADEGKAPTIATDCTAPTSDEDNNTALILGVIAGAAVVIAAVIVISTYLYRRRKRGKYNLLD